MCVAYLLQKQTYPAILRTNNFIKQKEVKHQKRCRKYEGRYSEVKEGKSNFFRKEVQQ